MTSSPDNIPASRPDYAELRRLTEAATPGPWRADPGPEYDPLDWVILGPESEWLVNLDEPLPEGWSWSGTTGTPNRIGEALRANAAYIAAANPQAIRALLDERDRLRGALGAIVREAYVYRNDKTTPECRFDSGPYCGTHSFLEYSELIDVGHVALGEPDASQA